MKKLFGLAIFAMFTMPVLQSNAGIIINFAADADPAGGGTSHSFNPVSGSLFSNLSDAAGGPLLSPVAIGQTNPTFSSFTLTDAATGTTQTFDLQLALSGASSTGTVSVLGRGGVGALGIDDGTGTVTLIDPDETLTIGAVTLLPVGGGPSLFQFDGFDTVFIGNTAAGESVIANGVSFTATTTESGTSFANAISIPLAQTITLEGNTGGVSLSGVDARFSLIQTIPEPSSLTMLALGGVGLLLKRRRS